MLPALLMRSRVLGRADFGHRPDLGDLDATGRRAALAAKGKEPGLARDLGGE